jgi:molybdopterin converting factor small subunit
MYKRARARAEIDVCEGETVRDLLVKVSHIFTNFPKISLDKGDEITKTGFWIFINGRNLMHLNDTFNTTLKNGDVISIVPAVAGG